MQGEDSSDGEVGTEDIVKPDRKRFINKLALLGLCFVLSASLMIFTLVQLRLLWPTLFAARALLLGQMGLLLIIFYFMYGLISFFGHNTRSALGGICIAAGILSMRLAIATYLSGGDIVDVKLSIPLPSTQQAQGISPDTKSSKKKVPGQNEPVKFVQTENPNDAAAYDFIRSLLKAKVVPPPEKVSVENIVNYFKYDYKVTPSLPISITYEIAPSIFNKGKYLLHVGLKASRPKAAVVTGSNLILLIDRSSLLLNPKSLSLLQEGLRKYVEQMSNDETLSLISYESSYHCTLPPTRGERRAEILQAIDWLPYVDAPQEFLGEEFAIEEFDALRAAGAPTFLALVTDTDINFALSRIKASDDPTEEVRYGGLKIIPKGFHHRYGATSVAEVVKVLDAAIPNEPGILAHDIEVEVQFNSSYIGQHQLVGYYDRENAKATVNADLIKEKIMDMGASITFLDEITLATDPFSASTPLNLGILKINAFLGDDVYPTKYSYPISSSNVRMIIDEASIDYRFAAAVAGYGLLLRQDDQHGVLQWPEVKRLATGALGLDSDGARHEFLDLINTASDLLPTGDGATSSQ